jgi:rod shape determining protein RodA
MNMFSNLQNTYFNPNKIRYATNKTLWQRFHIDLPLLTGLVLLCGIGFIVLYSASNQQPHLLVKQSVRLGIAMLILFFAAQIPPARYQQWAPWIFIFSTVLLISVLVIGKIGKGAQRWIDLGVLRFQPSELLKISVPLIVAWYLHECRLPPRYRDLFWCSLLIVVPFLLVSKQPDLGTALLIFFAGCSALLLAGIRWRIIFAALGITLLSLPVIWHKMHTYQQQRVLTFLSPERDPLGSGYHIIQSKIAIGSGGIFGKGWLNGTQSHLNFLPEHATDFIFAVIGEEFGLVGCIILIGILLFIALRGIYISVQAQDTFTRLLAGSLSISFFISFFVNIGMVSGILPVVGLPLPLVSYGGTSLVATMLSFGILMSISTHRKLLPR